jgi:energy-coupling factor transporter ATP-binding protein EcfA2
MRLTVPEPDIPEVGGFTDSNDLFGYRDFAGRLANVVGNIDEPLVIVLDGPWGSGKSVFIKQWAGLLRKRGAPVIYFDAFQNDYYEDAFLALSAEIYGTAKKALSGNESTVRRFLNNTKKAGTIMVPVATRVAARAATAGFLSLEDVAAGGEAAKAALKAFGDGAEKVVEKAISGRLRKAGDERAAMEAFRQALSELAVKLGKDKSQDKTYPLVFIVDELDRCRPPFALGIVERIKHLFSVPDVCFVLVTNLQQLETSVQGAYGATFDAYTYLEKFYHLRFALPANGHQGQKQIEKYFDYLWSGLGIELSEPESFFVIREQLKTMAEMYDLPFRRLERIMSHISLLCAVTTTSHPVNPPIAAGLCVMRQTHPELYDKARRQNLTWNEVQRFLEPTAARGTLDEWSVGCWKYATGEDISEEDFEWYRQSIGLYFDKLGDRTKLIPLMANYIDELVQRPPDEGR